MTMITISSSEIIKMTNFEIKDILEGLNNLGMPSEESNDEIQVEITPNRPDLFSIEGIARALNSFYNKKIVRYSSKKSSFSIIADSGVSKIRPYVVAAIVKNVQINECLLRSIIQLQEKLHDTIGRKRKKAAIGIHDYDKITFPLEYKLVNDEKFVPLDFNEEMNINEILDKHPKGKLYSSLVGPVYPIIYDKKGVVSFPPIINAERTRVGEQTRNLLIECTGTHLETLNGILNIIVCALADRGGEIYNVKINNEIYPKLKPMKMRIELDKINKLLGEKYQKEQLFEFLTLMGWKNNGKDSVFIPTYRMDISHYVDIIEEVAIAAGYNNFEPTTPNFFTSGKLVFSNEDLRLGMIGLGFIEVVNYSLTNEKLLKNIGNSHTFLKIINPKTEEFNIIRPNLVISLLNNLISNKTHELPIRIFEIGRVYKNKEELCLGFAISAETVDFAALKATLQSVALIMNNNFVFRPSKNPVFISGRAAEIYYENELIGEVGEIAPEVLERLGIENPVGICEIRLKPHC